MATDVGRLSAALILCGLLVTIGVGLLFPRGRRPNSISQVSATFSVPWSPRGLLGRGPIGRSPVFGFFWSLVYIGCFLFAILLLVTPPSVPSIGTSQLFTLGILTFLSLAISPWWSPIFTLATRPAFVASATILVTVALLEVACVWASGPFSTSESLADGNWVIVFGRAATGLFAGWSAVAAALDVAITTRVFDRGSQGARASVREGRSFTPLVLAAILAVFACVFRNPVVLAPLLITLLFVPKVLSSWPLWSAGLVGAAGLGVSIGLCFV